MNLHFKSISGVFITALKEWWEKDPFKESAVIAYYAVFSLPGLLVVVVTLAGYFFGQKEVGLQISSEITSAMGSDTSKQIDDIIEKGMESKNSTWATIIGVFTILIGATGVFAQFQKALNTIWEVKIDETKSGVWNLVKIRLFSFGLIITIAFILIVSLVVSATLSAMDTWVINQFSESFLVVLQIINFIFSLCILSFLFALMFKFFPDSIVKWRHVWIGSFVTTILFEIGKTGLGLYFSKAEPGSGYGAAGSIILILLWVSYSSMIVFYGAEFTHAYTKMRGGAIPQDQNV